MKPTIATKPSAPPVPAAADGGFVFENVGFQYPVATVGGSERELRLLSGRRVALVGRTAPARTTLTKLLARLYDRPEGRITLDGGDLATTTSHRFGRRSA